MLSFTLIEISLKTTINQVMIYNDFFLRNINRIFLNDMNNIVFVLIFLFIIVFTFNTFYVSQQEAYLQANDIHLVSNQLGILVNKIFTLKQTSNQSTIRFPEVMTKEENHELQQHQSNEIMFMLNHVGSVIYANEKTLYEFESSLQNVLGTSIFDIYHDLGNNDTTWYENVKNNNVSSSILKIQKENHEKWYFISYQTNLDAKGNVETILASGNDISSLINSEIVKEFYSEKDFITGLINQYGMFDQIRKFKNVNSGIAFCIQAMNFTEISNYYGHKIGDKLINAIVNDLKNFVSDGCLVVRYTESKFVVLCTNCVVSEESINAYVKTLEAFMTTSYEIGKLNLQIDKRIGYAVYPQDTGNFEELVSLSSIALKESVHNHSYEITRFNNKMKEDLKYNVEVANKLRSALDEEEIQVFFQKALNCESKKVFVIEELSRWIDTDLGYIPPNVFFKIAKETNQLNRLERYMMKKTLDAYLKIREQDEYKDTKVTINISPTNLLDIHFLNYFNDIVKQSGISPDDIYIEISESTFVNNVDLCLERITQYKANGYLIALDDFGTEYSSLSILESVDFDMIKIDAHFVQNIDKFSNQEIIKMIRTITAKTHKEIVAEGVETKEQSRALMELGCQIQQGFYYHRPENLLLYLPIPS